MRSLLSVVSLFAFASPALADLPIDGAELNDYQYIRLMPDGRMIGAGGGPGTRDNTVWYSVADPLYYTTTSLPNWHGGDICSFAPEGAGATDTLINLVTFPIRVPDSAVGLTGRAVVRYWELDPNLCDPTNGAFGTQIGGFQVVIDPPGLTDPTPGNGSGTVFIFQVAVDDVAPTTNGFVFPTEDFGVQYQYLDDAGTGPHAVWTFSFSTNMVNTADPADPANCVDPLNQPNPGSSFVNATPAALYMRDAGADGVLTVGDANGCIGTPNDIRGFAAGCPGNVLANLLCELAFDPPPTACGVDATFTDNDSNGSETVTLDANCSTDDTFVDTYTWTEGATEIVSSQNPVETAVLNVGVHTLTLEVADEFGVTSTDTVVITVLAGGGGSPCACANDPNGNDTDTDADGAIDLQDLATLLANFGAASGATCQQGDNNGDGDVDLQDLSNLLAAFGTIC